MIAVQPARLPRFAIPRPRVVALLDAVRGGEIGAVIAPAGSGKSVLISQWAADQDRTDVAWVDLTRSSSDPVVFARQFVDAMAVPLPAIHGAFDDLFGVGGGFPGPEFLARVVSTLQELETDLALVFDDMERIGALDAPAGLLEELLDLLPSTTRVFVVARWDPPIAFHRWRLEGRLHEFRIRDLAFDTAEAGELISAVAAHDLGEESLRIVVERTDGWATGIQLAAISMRRSADPDRFIREFAGTDTHVAEYLIEEVLSGLEAPVRQFLVQTSVLPWLSVEFCTHVIESDDVEEVRESLDHLLTHGLFLLPVDEHGRRVRYHKLFADLLRFELRRWQPELEEVLRRRAAGWLRAEGHLSDAAEEYVSLGDVDSVITLVREHGRRYYERNETATLARWLTAARHATTDPPAELEIHLLAAQFACHQITAAIDTSQSLRRRTDLTRGERAQAEALHALLGLHDLSPAETERAATAALEIVPTLGPGDCVDVIGMGAEGMIEFFAWTMRGHAAFSDGDVDRAVEMFERTLRTRESAVVAWRVYTLGALALVRAWTGQLSEAESLASTATGLAHEALTQHYIGLAYAQQAAALVALNRLDTEAVAAHLECARPIVERSYRPPLLGMQRLIRIASIAVERGTAAALREFESGAPPAIQPRLIDVATRSLHARLLIAAGRAPAARNVIGTISSTRGIAAARIDLALALDDCRSAKNELTAWTPSPIDLASVVGHHIRRAAVTWRDGSRVAALRSVEEALSLAETEGLRYPFLEVPAALALLRSEPQLHATPFANEILAAADSIHRRERSQTALADPLTDRELEILVLLPSRLSNSDLAATLFISVNTLKTHLRHIYVKLGAQARDDAIERAAELDLL